MDVILPSHRRTNPKVCFLPKWDGLCLQEVVLVSCQLLHSNWNSSGVVNGYASGFVLAWMSRDLERD